MSKFSFFIGCDVSKAVIDVSYHHNGSPQYLGQFSNNEKGFNRVFKLLNRINSTPLEEWFFCFENTGVYSKLLLRWCFENEIPCREENALKISRSLGLRRGKDDKVDSIDICQYLFEKRDSIKVSAIHKPMIIRLKKLLGRRDFLVRQRQSLKVSLKEQKGFIDDSIYERLSTGNKVIIEAYNNEISSLEVAIQDLIHNDSEMSINDKLARSVVGIGAITSAYIIAVTNNYTAFKDARKFACYCGVAPFPNRSGTRTGSTRISHIANKKMKSLFSNCITTAIVYDPEISIYYKRKREEGKRASVVMNAVKNKLIHRVFSVVKRKTPYVKLMTYA
jgi:transposase